ncbi:MAG: FAD/NAD(P)-binding protein [Xanthomonadales bacterium]|nr:FAD/NAD(P)-binding protein [Xanthomonadales bacterium]
MSTELLMPQPWVVQKTERENEDVVTLTLAPESSDHGFSFLPGQFNMLYAFGVGESAISISGDATTNGSMVHTIRDVGAVTHALSAAHVGDVIGIRGPYGSEWPIASHTGRDILVVAGGIGLAPLRPVVYHIIENRHKYKDVAVLYGSREPKDLLFRAELESWKDHNIQVEATVDNATPGWTRHIGVVTTLIRRAKVEPRGAAAFVCGPEIMMRFTASELTGRGMNPDDVFISMERNMKCAVGLCGRCQLGPEFICKDGPVFPWPRMSPVMTIREL